MDCLKYRSPLLQRQAQELVQNPIPKTRKSVKNLTPQTETGPNKYQNTQELILKSNPTKTKPPHPQRMASSVATNHRSPKFKTESQKPAPQPYTNTNTKYQWRRNPHGTRGTRLTQGAGPTKGRSAVTKAARLTQGAGPTKGRSAVTKAARGGEQTLEGRR